MDTITETAKASGTPKPHAEINHQTKWTYHNQEPVLPETYQKLTKLRTIMHHCINSRNDWRYQRGNQKPYIEGQTMQAKGQKHRFSRKHNLNKQKLVVKLLFYVFFVLTENFVLTINFCNY
jgi:hypothetical protein